MSSSPSGLSPGHGLVTRGLLMAALFATTFAIYGASALFSELVLGHAGWPALWLLMLATFVVAVVLPPVRRRVERWVNRLILGQRADAYELMTNVVSRMANTLAVDDVLPRLAEAAARSVCSQRGEVRLWLADGGESRQVWTADGIRSRPGRVDGPGLTVEVQHHGASVGEIGVDTETGMAAAGSRLLRELAAPAGLALSTVRLTLELRERLEQVAALNDQLRASQDRLVNARRIEQQRIRPRSTSGCGPGWMPLTPRWWRRGNAGPSGAKRLESLVAAARSGAVGALDALRGLATGIYPPRLAQAGLVAALEAWAERTGFRLKLAENQGLDRIRSSPSVEAAVYFVCVTALGDLAGKDETQPDLVAGADASASDDRLRFSLLVRGQSGRSSVLGPETVQVLQDRIDALGGEIAVQTSDPGRRRSVARPKRRRDPGGVLLPAEASRHGCPTAQPVHRTGLCSGPVGPGDRRPRLSVEGTGRCARRPAAGRGASGDRRLRDRPEGGRGAGAGGRSRAGAGELSRLTPREAEVLAAMAEGQTNTAIAASLVISQKAVEKHINSVFAKLGPSGDQQSDPRVRAVLMYLAEGKS